MTDKSENSHGPDGTDRNAESFRLPPRPGAPRHRRIKIPLDLLEDFEEP